MDSKERLNLGLKIYQARKRKGMSQAALAKVCGISRIELTFMEAGADRVNPERMKQVAKFLEN